MSTESSPRIGVVIPAYNAERWLARTLASLRAQDLSDWTAVVVDDGSADGTRAVAEAVAALDARLTIISQPNAGISGARGSGLASLSPDVGLVMLLDSDDVLEPDALSVLHAALLARPDAVGAYGLAEYVDGGDRPVRVGEHPRRQRDRRAVRGWRLVDVAATADLDYEEVAVGSPVWPSCVALWRRDALTEAGPWRRDMQPQEDWEQLLRLVRLGPAVPIDRVVAGYRRHAANLTGDVAGVVAAQARVRRAAWRDTGSSAAQRRTVARAWRYLRLRESAVLLVQARADLRDRGPVAAGRSLIGALVSTALGLLPGPPPERWAFAGLVRSELSDTGIRLRRRG